KDEARVGERERTVRAKRAGAYLAQGLAERFGGWIRACNPQGHTSLGRSAKRKAAGATDEGSGIATDDRAIGRQYGGSRDRLGIQGTGGVQTGLHRDRQRRACQPRRRRN